MWTQAFGWIPPWTEHAMSAAQILVGALFFLFAHHFEGIAKPWLVRLASACVIVWSAATLFIQYVVFQNGEINQNRYASALKKLENIEIKKHEIPSIEASGSIFKFPDNVAEHNLKRFSGKYLISGCSKNTGSTPIITKSLVETPLPLGIPANNVNNYSYKGTTIEANESNCFPVLAIDSSQMDSFSSFVMENEIIILVFYESVFFRETQNENTRSSKKVGIIYNKSKSSIEFIVQD